MAEFPQPDTENVVYIDEYPELRKKVWLRRLAQERMGKLATTGLFVFPDKFQDEIS